MPALPAFRKLFPRAVTSIDDLMRVVCDLADSIEASLVPLTENPRARSVVQTGVAVAATATVINHGLNLGAAKTPAGWAIVDIDTNATVKRTAWSTKTITLQASSACVIALEVW